MGPTSWTARPTTKLQQCKRVARACCLSLFHGLLPFLKLRGLLSQNETKPSLVCFSRVFLVCTYTGAAGHLELQKHIVRGAQEVTVFVI